MLNICSFIFKYSNQIYSFSSLTVLLKPSPPRITPGNPAATEGKPVNLTCSSVGGSPPPQVKENPALVKGASLPPGKENPALV